MMRPVVQLFVNPRPGWLARRRTAALPVIFEKAGAMVIVTDSISDDLTIDPRATHVCSVGGDGTLRHVVAAMHRSGRTIPISVYPAGTVNLVAREDRYPRSPCAFVRRTLNGDPRPAHYTALVDGMPLLACASVGPDSFAVAALSPILKRRIGRAAYVFAFCNLLLGWRRVTMDVHGGGMRFACEAVYVAKGRYFAGPWSFARDAAAADPILHVVCLARARRRDFARFAWTLLRRRPVDMVKGVQTFHCTELTISGAAAAPLQADGDIVAHLPVSISMRPEPTTFA